MISLRQRLASELVGTFAMVFAGTGAIVINDVSGGMVTHVGIAITFGLVVMTMIYAVGEVSGAHFNPAVTVGFVVARRMNRRTAGAYVVAQCAGALAASALLRMLFRTHPTLGATIPAGSASQSFVLETVLTFLLMFVILSVSTGEKEKGITAGIAVGGMIGLEAMFAGPICGASMNPARSLGPAMIGANFQGLWIYLTAPFIGACVAAIGCGVIHQNGCCGNGQDVGDA